MAPLKNICGTIKAMGFNTVRLPWSNEMLRISEKNSTAANVKKAAAAADAAAGGDEARAIPLASIDLSLNPELRKAVLTDNPLAVYDAVIARLGALQISVILNNHTTIGMWSGGVERNGMWFDSSEYTEAAWIADWVFMADRYRHLPFVIGYDLRNEVRPTSLLRPRTWPFWGGFSSTTPLPPPPSPTTGDDRPQTSEDEPPENDRGAASEEADAKTVARRWSLAAAPAAAKANKQQQKKNPEADWCRAAGEASRALLLACKAPGFIVVERIAWPQTSVADMLGSAAVVSSSTKDPRESNDLGPPFWTLWECPRDRFVVGVHSYAWSGPGAWSPRAFTGGRLDVLSIC